MILFITTAVKTSNPTYSFQSPKYTPCPTFTIPVQLGHIENVDNSKKSRSNLTEKLVDTSYKK
jgi:hypothetical protein